MLRSAGGSFTGSPFFCIRENVMKPFFTYEQQLEKLKSSGLIIADEEAALGYLKSEGYYNLINGYSHFFRKNNKIIPGTKFEDVLALYRFDKDLRNILYKYTSTIECHIKTVIAHEFSKVHGVDEKTYLTAASFVSDLKSQAQVEKLIEACTEIISEAVNRNSSKYREYIAHNVTQHNHVPLWILIRAMTFGTTSIFYKLMLQAEKENIAAQFNLTAEQLTNMLEIVVTFRNIVAHGERTFCAKLPRSRLTANAVTDKLNIEKNDKGVNKHGNRDVLALLICCKYLLNPTDFAGLMQEINSAIVNLSEIIGPSNMGRIRHEMGLKKSYVNDLLHKKFF